MKNTLSVTKAQAQFPAVCRGKETVVVTKNGEVVSYVVPRERMEAIFETLDIMGNPEAMSAIAKAKAGKGKYHPLSALDEK